MGDFVAARREAGGHGLQEGDALVGWHAAGDLEGADRTFDGFLELLAAGLEGGADQTAVEGTANLERLAGFLPLAGNIDGIGFRGSRGLQLCGFNNGCHGLAFLRT